MGLARNAVEGEEVSDLSLLGLAAAFEEVVRQMPAHQTRAMERAAVVIETEAKRVLGTYDYGWPPLAASTVARKANGDEPGLETGEMRGSIEHVSSHDELTVGSDNDKAVWFELGTSRQPPRSFLAGALIHKEDEVMSLIGDVVKRSFGGPAGGAPPTLSGP